ncbi:hypothetical protein BJ165DRAFT_1475282 [Panaeolus papilionaceus]|nr:hypothetical protein BJ165DRAFT_1475282 [Panaeolus papilionaceus]
MYVCAARQRPQSTTWTRVCAETLRRHLPRAYTDTSKRVNTSEWTCMFHHQVFVEGSMSYGMICSYDPGVWPVLDSIKE